MLKSSSQRILARTWENCRNPDKEKCPWKKGQNVYLVSNRHTHWYFGQIIQAELLGKKYTIDIIEWGGYSKNAYVHLNPHDSLSKVVTHQNDLSKENTFKNMFPIIPDFIKEVVTLDRIGDGYSGNYAMYIANKNDDETVEDLLHSSSMFEPGDPCDDCDGEDCHACDKSNLVNIPIDKSAKVQGFLNSDTDCWGDGAEMIEHVKYNFGKLPTRMGVILQNYDIRRTNWRFKPDDHRYLRHSEIQKFIKYMKQCRALPNYISVP